VEHSLFVAQVKKIHKYILRNLVKSYEKKKKKRKPVKKKENKKGNNNRKVKEKS
jgi:hypothetical protein